MALRFAIIRTVDATGAIDRALVDLDFREALAEELAAVSPRLVLRKRDFTAAAAAAAMEAVSRVEARLKPFTSTL